MIEIANVIRLIKNTNSSNDKAYLLKHYENVPGLKEVLRFIYNPYNKTGISTAKLKKGLVIYKGAEPVTYKEAIEYFTTHNTGSDADAAYAARFVRYTKKEYGDDTLEVAIGLVTQSMQIGVTATTLNKVYGEDFIPKTGCMLGTLYENVGHSKVAWPCIVTEKLDGVRRILIKENGVCKFFSRSGHEDDGLVEILQEAKYLPDNFVYDGELLAKGTFKDSIAQRQATNSIANLKGQKTGLVFNVFDMVPIKDFYAGYCKISAQERKIRLAATLKDDSLQLIDEQWVPRQIAFGVDVDLQYIVAVPILGVVHSLSEAEPIVEAIWARGGEGVMLNTESGPYEVKRSKHLLKVKHTEEHVLTVVDILEGTNKYEDSLGAIVVDYKGSKVGVGSGFTDAQRQEIWDNTEKYIGRKAEIETFGESTNSQGFISLNCPIFKRFVGEEE